MSDDFRFDDDDFDFDDDDFDFGDDDDFGDVGGDDLAYDDFADDVDLDNDDLFNDYDGVDEDLTFDPETDGAGNEGGGRSRTVLLVGGLFLIILLAGVLLLVFALSNRGNPELDMTRTAIAQANETTEALIQATNAQGTEFFNQTATATLFTPTPSATNTPSPSPTVDTEATNAVANATGTAEAIVAGTSSALTAIAQETIDAGENVTPPTEDPNANETPLATATEGGLSAVEAAQLTATALAGLFDQTPTVDVTQSTTTGGGTTTTTTTTGGLAEMPDTGLFDDVGADNAGVFFLMAFGLVGVIVGSRRLRSINKRKRD